MLSKLKFYMTKTLITILLVFFAAIVLLVYWHNLEKTKIETQFINEQRQIILDKKSAELKSTFNVIYQNLRTISLLPSIQNINGGNRTVEDEDVIKTGRFTIEGQASVQQIYNNMASLVSVSEIYTVMDGLDAGKGEVPFFMFDTLIFNGKVAEDEVETVNSDAPKESEEEEYIYFPKQTALIKSNHPRFTFNEMDEIPAYASPLMRTCDNSQYLSVSHGDAKETFGILYSVPFYNVAGDFRGVISAIIRANVLEAQLIGVPFIPVTQQDIAKQQQDGWKLPEPVRFLLSNEKYDINIFDRRNADLLNLIRQGKIDRNVFQVNLGIQSDAPWMLTYYLPESLIENAAAQHNQFFYLILTVILGALIATTTAYMLLTRLRQHLGADPSSLYNVASQIAGGDLSIDAPVKHGDNSSILASMQMMQQNLRNLIWQIKTSADSISSGAQQISAGNTDLSQRTEEQASSLEETASSMEEMASTVKQNAENAKQANIMANEASNVAVKGGEAVGQVMNTMSEINASSKKIVDIISVIDSIAFQTNILALNAAVEAARAGEQGRGFAVVAAEVRNLAQRSAAAAKEIKQLIGDSVEKVAGGTQLVGEAGKTMEEIVNSVKKVTDIVSEIAAASQEQSAGIDQVNNAITQMDEVTQQNAALVEEAAAAASSLEAKAQDLTEATNRFNLGDSQRTYSQRILGSQQSNRVDLNELKAARTSELPAAKANAGKRLKAPKAKKEEDWEEF